MTIEVINDNTNIGRIFNPVFRFEWWMNLKKKIYLFISNK
jgi:hypothetical protein